MIENNQDQPEEPVDEDAEKLTPVPSGQPRAFFNLISIIGFFMALIGLLGEIFFFLMSVFSGKSFAYQGAVIVLLAMIILIGVALFLFGYWLEKIRRKAGKAPSFSGQTLLRHPIAVMSIGLVLVAAVVLVFGMGTYQVFHVTESIEFCGQLCHKVMNPEWVTYHNSSHARVKCVECHIGAGADWFVRSKMSGIRQVYAVLAGDYPKPIPTPISNLRPARETCERCHWPKKFIGFKEKVLSYYLSDEKNSLHQIRLLLKIGGEEETTIMKGSGIHYHMLTSKVQYISKSPDRQEISYVRVQRPDRSVTEFNNSESPLSEEEKKNLELRTMDCLDCHNRPAHRFKTPMESVNDSIKKGLISSDIPKIKFQSINVLDSDYNSVEEAMVGISNGLRNYYEKNYPGFIETNPKKWQRAVTEIQSIYQQTIFPEMGAKWSAYPDNIGHRDWPGCFRCHNDSMKSAEGRVLFNSCNKCHLILAQGENIDQSEVNFVTGLPFLHPADNEFVEDYTYCNDCHTGGKELYE